MDTIDNALSTVFRNKYSSTLITMFLVFYSGLAAPKLPKFVVGLFENPIFRILILSLIVYNGNKDPQFAIMIAVGFTVTMNIISKQKLFEGFADNDLSVDSDLDMIGNSATDSDGLPSDGQPSDGQHSDGQPSDSQPSDGQPSDGQPSDSQQSDGQHSDGQHSDGQPSDSANSDSVKPPMR